MKARKSLVTLLLGIVTCLSLTFGVVFALPSFKTAKTAEAATTYTTKDVAMLGSIAGWYGNGNFTLNVTLGEADWTNADAGVKTYVRGEGMRGDMPGVLNEMDFFNKIEVGGKTLSEWGCTTCYDNNYELNSGEPDNILTLHLKMSQENMNTASAAGVGANSRLTFKEGALIPSYAYLQGNATATVYRAGCDFVTENSGVAYGIKAVGKTEVESVKYVQGHDGTCGYVGVSLKGDDYASNGVQEVVNSNSYQSSEFMTNHFQNKILVNGVSGKTKSYGLFNLGSKGKGYFSFSFYVTAEESETITIPAGTLFPSYAMTNLHKVNGNPVYIMYETQTDVTFYKQADGTWVKPYAEEETSVTSVKVQIGDSESDLFTVFSLSNHDYAVELDNYGGTAVSTKDVLSRNNFYNHILVNDVAIGSTSEAFINVWGNKGAIGIRTSAGLNATKITILKGCNFPSYAELLTGERKIFVTTEDITFVKGANGEWTKYIPEGDFDTSVTQVQFGRSTNVLNINLSANDYPSPDGNNSATYNIGVDAEKILALNLFDNIIIDGYSIRSRYANYPTSVTAPWVWINRFVGHNFAVRVPNVNGTALTPNKITIRAGAQFPSMAYINGGAEAYYVTTEEVTYVRVSDNVETSWDRQAKITFKADGMTVETLAYNTRTNEIDGEIPEVPEKEGHKGVWESYTLNGEDIVVNAVYTAHDFTEIETNISKMEYKDSFIIVFLTNHDFTGAGYTLSVKERVPTLHFFDYVEVDGKIASTNPASVSKDAFINVWGGYEGAFATYLPCAAPVSKVVLKKGCQIPSNAYRLDANNKTCFVLTKDVTFIKEGDAWVRQSSGESDEEITSKPTYDNDYILSDLYNTSHSVSEGLKKGYLYVDKTTAGNVYGYNISQSFSLTFDFALNLGSNDVSAQGNYSVFAISLATRGYNSANAFGWNFYLYRPGNGNKCIEFFVGGTGKGTWEEVGTFEKGKTYRVTLGYKLLDENTGTVQTYVNFNGSEVIREIELGADYYNLARNADSIAFTSSTAITKGVRISDPDLTDEDSNYNLVLKNNGQEIVNENAWKYVLPTLNAYECGKPNEVFIGWTANGKLYPAGYEYELTGNTTFESVWLTMYVVNGAAVRKTGNSGLRFSVNINGNGYSEALDAGLIDSVGTLIVPTSYLADGKPFVHESFPEGYFIDVPTETWTVDTGDTWTYVAALVNISPAQYAREMSARGYLKINYASGEGYVYTAYSKDLHSRSIYSVATSAFNDDVKVENVLSYVNNVADITINDGFNVSKNGVGNYDISSSKDGENYTVTFSKSVKAVVINGTRILAGYESEILIGNNSHKVNNVKLSSNGLTLTFTVEEGDSTAYYKTIAEYYRNSNEYTSIHKEKILAILDAWNDNYSNADTNNYYVTELEKVKTQTELEKNVGSTKLTTPTISFGLGYTVTWNAVANADYYLVTDDNDYRNGVYVLAGEELSYKTEVVGKHNVTVTAYSYYEDYARSDASPEFATIEVKPVFSYKAMANGLYKFTESEMKKLGIGDNLNTKNDGTSYRYDKEAKKYFAYYNKDTGWSINEGYATDWTSPKEFPAHAQRLKDMGNNVILLAENTSASLPEGAVWETSRAKYVMDTAWTLGMKVIVCDDVLYKKSKEVGSVDEAKSVIAGRKQLFDNYVTHPAFFGFSLEDEPEKGDEIKSVAYTIKALKEECAKHNLSKANGNEPFFLACLYQKNVGFSTIWNYDDYLESWIDETGLDYLYVDLYTGHAMGDSTNRYTTTFEAVYKKGLGVIEGDVKFHQAITAHTQNKGTEGKLTEQDLYMSLMYAAAHNVAGYSWFCYFPIVEEMAGSMVGFDGNGYGNGIGNQAETGKSYYNAAKTAGYQFELIQGLFNGYSLQTRNHSSNLLTTTLSNGANTITMYVNADVQNMSATKTVTASGSVCYLVGYGVGTADAPYQVVSGSITLQPGQAVICVG